jgi:hypothetical protein
MVKSVEGIFRNGKVELLEPPPTMTDAKVIVTFLSKDGNIDLDSRGVSAQRAADLRARLGTFAEDWDRPDMDVYDAL